jgi:hypothetical protein
MHNLYGQQGNYNFQNFGNKSILLTGNVTGSVEDFAVSYYNPARLTELNNNTFSVNSKAYQYSKIKLKDAVGTGVDFKNSNFEGIPSMIAGTFKIKNEQFAYTFLSKTIRDSKLNYGTSMKIGDVLDEFSGLETYSGSIRIGSKISEEWLGLTWAKKLNTRLSYGVSLFASLFNENGESEFDYTIQHSENLLVATYKNNVSYEQVSYGLVLKTGLNYNFNKASIGVNLTLPHIGIWNDGEFQFKEIVAGIGQGTDRFVSFNKDNLKSSRKTPFSIAVGSGIMIGKHKMHLNASLYSGSKKHERIDIPSFQQNNNQVYDFQFEESTKPIVNFGFGAELFITKDIDAYISFATDYSAYVSNANIFDLNSLSKTDTNFSQNFYHYGAGFQLKFKTFQLVLGSTYTRNSANFSKPIKVESEIDSISSLIAFVQWQFVFGVEVPLFSKKLKF